MPELRSNERLQLIGPSGACGGKTDGEASLRRPSWAGGGWRRDLVIGRSVHPAHTRGKGLAGPHRRWDADPEPDGTLSRIGDFP